MDAVRNARDAATERVQGCAFFLSSFLFILDLD